MNRVSANGISTMSERGPQSQRYSAISASLLLSLLLGVGLLVAVLGLAHSVSAHADTPLKGQETPLLPTPLVSSLAASPTCGPDWAVVSSPNVDPGDDNLAGVAASSSNDIWAVGYQSYGDSSGLTLIEHWNGSAWSVISSPSPGNGWNGLNGVAAISASDAWAVGSFSDNYGTYSLIEHWDGHTWSAADKDRLAPNGSFGSLNSVAARSSSDVWAVGYQSGSNGTEQTLIDHWNGAGWGTSPSSGPGDYRNYLEGVAAISANDVWAVGYYETLGSPDETLIEHWNGTQWSVVSGPVTESSYLYSVAAVSSSDVWAVGYYYTDSATQTLIEHWNGHVWSFVPSPNVGTDYNELYGVATVSSSDVWAVGHAGRDNYQTLAEHWNGASWSVISGPDVQGSASLAGVTAISGSDVWAVGPFWNGMQGRTLVERYNPCPSSCALQFEDVPNPSTFYAYVQCLACRGIINGYACGGAGEPCNANHDPYFRPDANVTRGQIAKIIALSANIHTPVSVQTFEDVPPGSAFYTYTEQLYALAVMGGYPCGTPGDPCNPPANRPYFRPNNNATRGQLAKIDSNAAGYNDPPSGQTFQDVAVASTYYTYTQRLTNRGVMSGYACGGAGEPCGPSRLPYFRPNADVTRGQTSKIVGNTFFPDCSSH